MKTRIIEAVISCVVSSAVLVGMYYLWKTFNIPVAFIGASMLFAITLYLTISYFKAFDTHKRITMVGLVIAFLALSILSAYKHFVSDIRINTFLIIGVLMAPILIGKIIEKKSKENDF